MKSEARVRSQRALWVKPRSLNFIWNTVWSHRRNMRKHSNKIVVFFLTFFVCRVSSFIHIFNKYLWSNYCDQCTVSEKEHATITQEVGVSALHGVYSSSIETNGQLLITQEVISIYMARNKRGSQSRQQQ